MYDILFNQVITQPRERVIEEGIEGLSNQELLTILIGTGTVKQTASDIAGQILKTVNNLAELRTLSLEELQGLVGIGRVKAIEFQAMIELGKRINKEHVHLNPKIRSCEKLAQQMMIELGDKPQEHLVAIYLNAQNKIIRKKTIFIGSVSKSIAEPREIMHYAVKSMASSVILVHNHPSGSVSPSKNDLYFTEHLQLACEVLGINLLDHIIVGYDKYYSFRKQGKLDNVEL